MKETKFNVGDIVFGIYNYRIHLWRVKQIITTTTQSEYSTTMKSEYVCQMITDGELTMHNTFEEFDLYTKKEFTNSYNFLISKYDKNEKN